MDPAARLSATGQDPYPAMQARMEIDGPERRRKMEAVELLAVIISLLALLISAIGFGQSLERRRRD